MNSYYDIENDEFYDVDTFYDEDNGIYTNYDKNWVAYSWIYDLDKIVFNKRNFKNYSDYGASEDDMYEDNDGILHYNITTTEGHDKLITFISLLKNIIPTTKNKKILKIYHILLERFPHHFI
jgi:hypothetical protein